MTKNVKLLVYTAMLTALVTVATFIHVPTLVTNGYANLGDGFILASAFTLGPWAAFAGGVGSMLSDLILGYAVYAPATLVIKGLMGLLCGLLLHKCGQKPFTLRRTLLFILCEIWMVLGYYIFEAFVYGVPAAAGSVFGNMLQGVVGVAVGLIMVPILGRIKNASLK